MALRAMWRISRSLRGLERAACYMVFVLGGVFLEGLMVTAALGNAAAAVLLGVVVVRFAGASDWESAVVYSVVAAVNVSLGAFMAYMLTKTKFRNGPAGGRGA